MHAAARILCATLAGWLVDAGLAHAQEHNSVAVGLNFTQRLATASDAHGDGGFGLKVRLGHDEDGWGVHYGLNWYSTKLDRPVGGQLTRLGELKIRPFLGGYGYTHALSERVSITADVIGGFGFSAFKITPEAVDAFFLHMPLAPSEPVRISTSTVIPVVKPEVSLWYDLNRRFGISVDTGYIIARPSLTISTSLGSTTDRIRADSFTLSGGFVFRVF
jgi:hypothetical protein